MRGWSCGGGGGAYDLPRCASSPTYAASTITRRAVFPNGRSGSPGSSPTSGNAAGTSSKAPPGGGADRAREAVAAVHEERYVDRFGRAAERGDSLLDSADNPLSDGTWEAAWAGVETTLAAADHAVSGGGRGNRAFAAVRPPGHH